MDQTKTTTAPSNSNTPTGNSAPMGITAENSPTQKSIPSTSQAPTTGPLPVPTAELQPSKSGSGAQDAGPPPTSSTPTEPPDDTPVQLVQGDLKELRTAFQNIGARLLALEGKLAAPAPAAAPQQSAASLTAPPGSYGDAGPLAVGPATGGGGISGNDLKLLEFLKPFLQPDQPQGTSGMAGLAQRLLERTIENSIDTMDQNKRLTDSLIQRVLTKEAEKALNLPPEKTRVVHTVANRA